MKLTLNIKTFIFVLFCIAFANNIFAQGISKYGQITSTSGDFVNQNGITGSIPKLNKHGQLVVNIGDSYLGGIVAYILQSGDPGYIAGQQHGLIAAPTDQSLGLQWYNGSYIATGATATALGSGNANTNTIVNIQGEGDYAAKLCYDLVLGGYSDWYLPSMDELTKLYINRVAIGGFTWTYWSSSEYIFTSYAWSLFFYDGTQQHRQKNLTTNVRAIRSF